MAQIKNIVLSTDELQHIKDNSSSYLKGAEGIIIKQPDRRVVRKILLSEIKEKDYDPKEVEQTRENKRKKIIQLASMPDLLNELKVTATMTDEQGKFIGYEMTSPVELFCLDTNPLNPDEKLEYLKILKRRLQDFHSHGIVYGDIKESNVLVNYDQAIICFCDLDNVQLGFNNIDLLNFSLNIFSDENGYLEPGADVFMFNILTLNQLYYPNLDYREVIEKIRKASPKTTAPKEVQKILRKMKRKSTQYDGGYLIDYL